MVRAIFVSQPQRACQPGHLPWLGSSANATLAMSSDVPDDPRTVAIDALRDLGLSTYAARTFVALAALGVGTAKDVSEVSDVPRTRVYDAIDELSDRGLVDVQQASPKEFWAVSAETTGRTFQEEYQHRTQTQIGRAHV